MMLPKILALCLLMNFSFFHSVSQEAREKKQKIKYLPLGDSYTICEGARYSECWTELLTVNLHKRGVQLEIPANPARSGFTTKDLIERELPLLEVYNPDFITLLIGVNDWVQGVPKEEFLANYKLILNRIQSSLTVKENILILTIPDFSVKPEGEKYAKGRDISKGLSAYNEIIMKEASARGLKVVDLFKVSQEMKYDKQSVAADGLHPSAKEYAVWEKLISPIVFEMLREKED